MSEFVDSDYTLYPKTGGRRGFEVKEGIADNRRYRDTDGLVETVHGIVRAYSAYFENSYKVSNLEIIKDGRLYSRRWGNKEYTARGLVMKAKQFANDIFGKA